MSKTFWLEVSKEPKDSMDAGTVVARFMDLSQTQAQCIVDLAQVSHDYQVRYGRGKELNEVFKPTHKLRARNKEYWTDTDRQQVDTRIEIVCRYRRIIDRKGVHYVAWRYADFSRGEATLDSFERRFEEIEG